MSTPSISVIVPFFDSEQHIEACLRSLLAARAVLGEPVELLFVDNASPDRSADVVRRFPEVKLLREETPGAYPARNSALRVAKAPVIAFTDADCAVDPGWLRAILKVLKNPQVAVVLGAVRYPEQASWALRLLGAYENAKTDYVLRRCPSAYHFAYANNMAVRASVFEAIGPFKAWRRAADSELVHRLAARQPVLRVAYQPSMRVSHLEFVRFRARARRLSLYTETNTKIESFRELGVLQRLAVIRHMMLNLHRR